MNSSAPNTPTVVSLLRTSWRQRGQRDAGAEMGPWHDLVSGDLHHALRKRPSPALKPNLVSSLGPPIVVGRESMRARPSFVLKPILVGRLGPPIAEAQESKLVSLVGVVHLPDRITP